MVHRHLRPDDPGLGRRHHPRHRARGPARRLHRRQAGRLGRPHRRGGLLGGAVGPRLRRRHERDPRDQRAGRCGSRGSSGSSCARRRATWPRSGWPRRPASSARASRATPGTSTTAGSTWSSTPSPGPTSGWSSDAAAAPADRARDRCRAVARIVREVATLHSSCPRAAGDRRRTAPSRCCRWGCAWGAARGRRRRRPVALRRVGPCCPPTRRHGVAGGGARPAGPGRAGAPGLAAARLRRGGPGRLLAGDGLHGGRRTSTRRSSARPTPSAPSACGPTTRAPPRRGCRPPGAAVAATVSVHGDRDPRRAAALRDAALTAVEALLRRTQPDGSATRTRRHRRPRRPGRRRTRRPRAADPARASRRWPRPTSSSWTGSHRSPCWTACARASRSSTSPRSRAGGPPPRRRSTPLLVDRARRRARRRPAQGR